MDDAYSHQYLRTIGKGIIISAGSFLFGFLFYYLKNKKKMLTGPHSETFLSEKLKNKSKNDEMECEIPLKTLERMVKKIKNKIVILLANLYDKTVLLNIVNQTKIREENEKDIQVETLSSGEIARLEENNKDDQNNQSGDYKNIFNTSKKNIEKKHNMKTFFNCNLNFKLSKTNS